MRTSQRRNVLSIDEVRNVSSVGQILKLTTLKRSINAFNKRKTDSGKFTVLYVLNSIVYIYFLPIVIIVQNLEYNFK
jgi:hypothetical protein